MVSIGRFDQHPEGRDLQNLSASPDEPLEELADVIAAGGVSARSIDTSTTSCSWSAISCSTRGSGPATLRRGGRTPQPYKLRSSLASTEVHEPRGLFRRSMTPRSAQSPTSCISPPDPAMSCEVSSALWPHVVSAGKSVTTASRAHKPEIDTFHDAASCPMTCPLSMPCTSTRPGSRMRSLLALDPEIDGRRQRRLLSAGARRQRRGPSSASRASAVAQP